MIYYSTCISILKKIRISGLKIIISLYEKEKSGVIASGLSWLALAFALPVVAKGFQ